MMDKDIVERLRRTKPSLALRPSKPDAREPVNPDGPEAATKIEALTKRNAELEGALRLWLTYDEGDQTSGMELMMDYNMAIEATRAALNSTKGSD